MLVCETRSQVLKTKPGRAGPRVHIGCVHAGYTRSVIFLV